MELRKADQKQTDIKIEVVSNGFIVKENYYDSSPRMCPPGEACKPSTTKVFNTKQQLKNYIDKEL